MGDWACRRVGVFRRERFAPQIVILSSPESLRGKRSSLEKEPVVRLVSSISLRFTPQSVPSAHSPHRVSNSFSLTLCTLKVTADDSFPSERLSVLLINVVGFGGHGSASCRRGD